MTDDFTCRDLVELVTEYLEGALSPEFSAAFERHIAECPSCREYLDQIRLTIALTGSMATVEDLSTEAVDALVDAFRDWRKRPMIDS